MKTIKRSLVAVALAASVLGAPAFAATFSNIWSFTDSRTGNVISGTLNGLSNGNNLSASGLTATVTQSPNATLLGSYTFNPAPDGAYYDQYSASNGIVTFANFFLTAANTGAFGSNTLFFGTSPSATYYPELAGVGRTPDYYNQTAGTRFSAVTAAVPEPATWALMIFGMGAVGFAMRRRKNVNMTVRFA